jgi:hypothetical protein
LVGFTLSGLGLATRPLRYSRPSFGQTPKAPFRPLMDLGSAPEYDPRLTAAEQLPSWDLQALRRLRQREATYTGFASPGCAASSGFLSLLTPSSSRSLPALFHAGNAHGLSPFRGLPFSRGRRNLSVRLPLLALLERGSATVTATRSPVARRRVRSPTVDQGLWGGPEAGSLLVPGDRLEKTPDLGLSQRPLPKRRSPSKPFRWEPVVPGGPVRSMATIAGRPSRPGLPVAAPGAPPPDIEPGVLPVPGDALSSTSGRRSARLPSRHPEGCRGFVAMAGSVHQKHCRSVTDIRPG